MMKAGELRAWTSERALTAQGYRVFMVILPCFKRDSTQPGGRPFYLCKVLTQEGRVRLFHARDTEEASARLA